MGEGHKRRWPSWLEQLLGPTRPEMGCDECFARLDAYVELELAGLDAARRMPRLAAHLDGCGVCREEHDDLLAFLRSREG